MALVVELSISHLSDRFDARFHVFQQLLASSWSSGIVSKPLSELAATIRRGQSPGRLGYSDSGVPILKSVNVREGYLSLEKLSFVSEEYFGHQLNAQARDGDVLVTSTGEGTLGRAALFDSATYRVPRCLVTEKLTMVRDIDAEQVFPAYLAAFLNSPAGTTQLIAYSRGSTGKTELYPDDIAKVLIPLMPQPAQQDIARHYRRSMVLRQQALAASRTALTAFSEICRLELAPVSSAATDMMTEPE